jgi:uncharacterized membrane protein YcaP (DUF421 family)
VRAAGFGHLSEVSAVVLETEGSCSVVQRKTGADTRVLQGMDIALEKNQD